MYPPAVWFANAMTSLWCYLFVLLRFRLYAFVEPRSFVQSYFDMQASRLPHVFFFFLMSVYLEMSLSPSIFCTIAVLSLYGVYVVRSFLPDGVFLPCDHGLDF